MALRPVAKRHGVRHEVAQVAAGDDAAADAAEARVSAAAAQPQPDADQRSEEHTSELQSPCNLVCRLLLEKKK